MAHRVVIWLLSHFHFQMKLPDNHLWLNQGVQHEFLIKIKFLFLELQENFPPTVPISLMKGRLDGNAVYSMWMHSGFLWACSAMAKCLLLPWQLIASNSNADALRFSPWSVSHLLTFNCSWYESAKKQINGSQDLLPCNYPHCCCIDLMSLEGSCCLATWS